MYALLSQNNNYLIDKKSHAKIRYETKHLDNLNFDMKKKLERLSFFDPNDIFNQSEDSFLEDDKINNRSLKLSFENSKSYKHVSSSYVKTSQSKGKYVSQKIKFYKLAIKWLDVISTILIIISMLIAQIENQNFYEKNLERRTTLIKIANYIISKNFSGYNDIEVDKSLNYTNFKNTFDKNEISSLKVDLEIDDISQKLRYTILSLSVISVVLIIFSRWFEYIREFIYTEKNEKSFIKTIYFQYLIIDIFLLSIIQYPGLNGYFLYSELGSPFLMPYSSLLYVFSLSKIYFLLKLFKHLTRWTSSLSENVCERYVCKASTSFAFKAFQKENPFYILILIFMISCYCFGEAIRTFEIFYWENFDKNNSYNQNWNYQWNAMWFVFVTMTTVGYGDLFPKTQFGRCITIMSALVGVYFVSMMMVFMTQKSLMTDKEDKAYKLITRLKYRNYNKDKHADLIHIYFQYIIVKRQKDNRDILEIEYDSKSKYLKRSMNNLIYEIKLNKKYIHSCDFIPTKEILFDTSENLDYEIKNIFLELHSLEMINDLVKIFTEDQLEIVDYLRKNLETTKLFIEYVKNNKILGKVGARLQLSDLLEEIPEKTKSALNNTNLNCQRRMTNPQQYEEIDELDEKKSNEAFESIDDFEGEGDLLAENEYKQDEIQSCFDYLFTRKNHMSVKKTKTRIINDKLIDHTNIRKDSVWKKIHRISIKIPQIASDLKKTFRNNSEIDDKNTSQN